MKRKLIKKILLILFIVFIVLMTSFFVYIYIIIRPVKNIDVSLSCTNNTESKFYDINGDLINYENFRDKIELSDLNSNTIQAFIAIEDKNFFEHKGLNYRRIVKAFLSNLKSGKYIQGASTISQQLVKNKYLTSEKSISRKIKEAYLTLKMEKQNSKKDILVDYLNTIYFGNGAYGIADASKKFFNKDVKDLSLNESCTLAGIIKSPYNYSPINNYDKCIERRNLVLNEMLNDGFISEDEYNITLNEKLEIKSNNKPYGNLYLEYAIIEACDKLNINRNQLLYGNYQIFTNQDSEIQKHLDSVINNENNYNKNRYGNIGDSLSFVIDNKTNKVSAVAGKSKYDMININRQPGSLIKPILVYAPAMEEGVVSPITQINDEYLNINGYEPNNVGNKFYGYISVKDSIAKSLNIPSIKVCEKVGLEKCKEYAKKCGINLAEQDVGYSVALGGFTEGVDLKSLTDSYSVFTNNGYYKKSDFIANIKKDNINILNNNLMPKTKVFNEDTTYLMTECMIEGVKKGTSQRLKNFDFDIAGKTGTVGVKGSNYNTDAYSLAYTTDHTMSVWIGNYSMEKEHILEGNDNGGTYATSIIKKVFDKIYEDTTPTNFQKPDSVSSYKIDIKSLNENHIVLLADNLPDRYVLLENLSVRYAPKEVSQNFIANDNLHFDIEIYDNIAKISFECNDYNNYYLYKLVGNEDQLIQKISNYNGKYLYKDKDIYPSEKYKYYLKIFNKITNTESKTNFKEIILTDNKLFNNNDDQYINNDISFIFR